MTKTKAQKELEKKIKVEVAPPMPETYTEKLKKGLKRLSERRAVK